jgi:hypothetical protein
MCLHTSLPSYYFQCYKFLIKFKSCFRNAFCNFSFFLFSSLFSLLRAATFWFNSSICFSIAMIQEKQLKDDHGELFGFGTHMFRHYYGVKLTEMHLDDWTIARLLGHKRLNNVQHYRKMSNQRMADETREVRQRMSDIIYMSLARWGEEYEQIRQDD